jgi:hypothetical protein
MRSATALPLRYNEGDAVSTTTRSCSTATNPVAGSPRYPSIPGCHALMPTREAALTELTAVFQMIADEYAERNQALPADTTEILHA